METHDPSSERGADAPPGEAYQIITDLTSDYAYSFLVDDAGNLTPDWLSGGYEALTGFTSAEVEKAGGWPAMVHPDDIAPAGESFAKLLAGEQAEMELRIIRKDGGERWVHCKTIPVQDDNGKTYRIYGAVQDVTERVETERALRESEERYRRLIDLSPDAIAVHADGRILYANPAAARLMRADDDRSLVGCKVLDLVHPDYHDLVSERMRRVLENGEDMGIARETFVRFDGTLIEVEVNGSIVNFEGQRAMQVIVRDISERLRSTALVEGQAEVLRLVARGAPLREVLDMTARRIEEMSSGALCSILLLKDNLLSIGGAPHLPDEWNDFIEGLEIGPQQGSCGTAAYTGQPVVVADITIHPYWDDYRDEAMKHGLRACWSYPIRGDDSGEILGTFALYYREAKEPSDDEWELVLRWADLAAIAIERARAVEALTRSEERFNELAENIEEVFWISDRENNRAVYVSPAFEQIWGMSPESIYDHAEQWLQSIHPDDRQRVRELYQKAPDEGFENEYRIVRPDGTVRWIKDRGFPVQSADGPPTRVAGVSEDITERKRLEEHLLRTQRMEAVGRLAGGVAHDFNNLLFVILNSARFVAEELPDGDPKRHDVDEIIGAGERAARLTRQLLVYSRKEIVSPKVLDINDVVRRMDDLLRRTIGEDVELTSHLGRKLRQVRIDPTQLEQVIVNLAVNARDAMKRGGTLSIETSNAFVDETSSPTLGGIRTGPYVCLTMSDTGMGMTPEVARQAFEPFFTTKEVGEGSGLGLATVYGIVTQADGHVNVYSEPRIGTTFRIYLPAAEGTPEEDTESLPMVRHGSGETILIAEDDSSVLDLAARILKKQGYKVLRATSGHVAMQHAQADGDIDILLTDVIMPKMSGRELAIHLKTIRPDVKVLFMSGYTADIIGRHGILDEDQNYMQKPFTAEELLAKVQEVLDR